MLISSYRLAPLKLVRLGKMKKLYVNIKRNMGGGRSPQEDGYTLCPSSMGAEIPTEPHKLAIVTIFLLFAGVSNWIALAYIHDLVGRDPLPDAIFSVIPEIPLALKIGDFMVTLCSASLILTFIVHKQRCVVIRRTFFIVGTLYAMRTISLLCTQLPSGYIDNDERCRRQLNVTERTAVVYLKRLLEQTIHIGFQDIEDKMLCGDLLFSGHTLVMVVSAYTISYYLPSEKKWLGYFPKFFAVVGMICMIISRTHYTIDVVFAYWLSLGVFTLYHTYTEIDTYRERKNSVLSQWWFIRIIVSWLEENVIPGRIENEFEIPIIPTLYKKCIYSKSKRASAGNSNTVSTTSSEMGIENIV